MSYVEKLKKKVIHEKEVWIRTGYETVDIVLLEDALPLAKRLDKIKKHLKKFPALESYATMENISLFEKKPVYLWTRKVHGWKDALDKELQK